MGLESLALGETDDDRAETEDALLRQALRRDVLDESEGVDARVLSSEAV